MPRHKSIHGVHRRPHDQTFNAMDGEQNKKAVHALPRFRYTVLEHSIRETRLAELLPGNYGDNLHVRIHIMPLKSFDAPLPEQIGFKVEDLQKDLPDDWLVRETINGRFIFERKREYGPQEPYETSWEHPEAKFEPVANNYNLVHTKPEYEALSHVWGPEEEQTMVFVQPLQKDATERSRVYGQSGLEEADYVWSNTKGKRTRDDEPASPGPKRRKTESVPWLPCSRITADEEDDDICNNVLDESGTTLSVLPIQSDLAIALRHLRFPNRSRMLWVDNICINQDDIGERSQLVRHMSQIYRLAQKVIVWLGPEYSNSNLAMSKLDYLGRQVEITNKGSWRVNAPGCLEPTWSRTAVSLPYDDETWEAIRALVQRPWFRRLWVWQEAKLSNDDSIIQCGQKKMELYRFGAAAWCAGAKAHLIPAGLQIPLFRAGDAVLRQMDEPFLHTLLHLNEKQCSDPRDKIYGALGLAPSQVATRIVPGYDKDVDEIYTDAAIALCHATDRVDFLVACNLANRTVPGATWAPDWSVAQRRSPRWVLSTALASGISISTAEIVQSPKPTLLVQGVQCGTVCSVRAKAPTQSDDTESIHSVIRSWAPHGSMKQMYVTDRENVFDAFVKTVHWNTLRERCPWDSGLLRLSEAREIMQNVLSPSQPEPAESETMQKSSPHKPLYREALGRWYIELDNGYIGMASAEVKETDIVCVILGCPLPMVLRPHSSGRNQVVGPAYIHGLMDTEGLLGPLPKHCAVQGGSSSGWYGGSTIRNMLTDDIIDDPRLGKLPPSWVRVEAVRTSTDPLQFFRFRNLATGKSINGDPRLLPEALRARGVPLKPLKLV